MLILYMVTLNASGPKMLSLETASKQAGVAAGVCEGGGEHSSTRSGVSRLKGNHPTIFFRKQRL